mmetsp:Transcript_106411/g.174653  ORF Transcript_106411/g.174653 Transcript_106411/m.174653 type:complete len:442 (+) Transcript_106411:221-1546(+)
MASLATSVQLAGSSAKRPLCNHLSKSGKRRDRMRRTAILQSQLDTAALQRRLKDDGFWNHDREQCGAEEEQGGNIQTVLERLEGKIDACSLILQTVVEGSLGLISDCSSWPVVDPNKQFERVLEGLEMPGVKADALAKECAAVRKIQGWYRRVQNRCCRRLPEGDLSHADGAKSDMVQTPGAAGFGKCPAAYWDKLHSQFANWQGWSAAGKLHNERELEGDQRRIFCDLCMKLRHRCCCTAPSFKTTWYMCKHCGEQLCDCDCDGDDKELVELDETNSAGTWEECQVCGRLDRQDDILECDGRGCTSFVHTACGYLCTAPDGGEAWLCGTCKEQGNELTDSEGDESESETDAAIVRGRSYEELSELLSAERLKREKAAEVTREVAERLLALAETHPDDLAILAQSNGAVHRMKEAAICVQELGAPDFVREFLKGRIEHFLA